MNKLFGMTLITIFLSIAIESLSLILQLKRKKLSQWFGRKDFTVHATVTLLLWGIAFLFIILLQFQPHPHFHNNNILKIIGSILFIAGLVISVLGFKQLGLKRSLCLNFFRENVPVENKSIYSYIKEPEDYGFWILLIGFALFTGSIFNTIIAAEYIILMIPHEKLENIPVKHKRKN